MHQYEGIGERVAERFVVHPGEQLPGALPIPNYRKGLGQGRQGLKLHRRCIFLHGFRQRLQPARGLVRVSLCAKDLYGNYTAQVVQAYMVAPRVLEDPIELG